MSNFVRDGSSGRSMPASIGSLAVAAEQIGGGLGVQAGADPGRLEGEPSVSVGRPGHGGWGQPVVTPPPNFDRDLAWPGFDQLAVIPPRVVSVPRTGDRLSCRRIEWDDSTNQVVIQLAQS